MLATSEIVNIQKSDHKWAILKPL